jgi:rhodanese-related sulfurtransferase
VDRGEHARIEQLSDEECWRLLADAPVGRVGLIVDDAPEIHPVNHLVRPGQPLVVVTDEGRETEAKGRLARIGFDRVRGAVVDVECLLADCSDLAAQAARLAARDLASWRDEEPNLQIIDVRNASDHETGVVPSAMRVPLARLLDRYRDLDPTAPTVVYCATGYRSSIAASLLRSVGFTQVVDLQGGYDAWAAAGLPTVNPETVT